MGWNTTRTWKLIISVILFFGFKTALSQREYLPQGHLLVVQITGKMSDTITFNLIEIYSPYAKVKNKLDLGNVEREKPPFQLEFLLTKSISKGIVKKGCYKVNDIYIMLLDNENLNREGVPELKKIKKKDINLNEFQRWNR